MKVNKVFIASDHAGFTLKESIKKFLIRRKKKVLDLGPNSNNSVDQPDYAHRLSRKIKNNNREIGILVCGSGIGMDMTANKHKNIRAALCYNALSTKLSRQHNNANVVCIPARFIDLDLAKRIVNTFIETNFEGGRHQRRVDKIACQ